MESVSRSLGSTSLWTKVRAELLGFVVFIACFLEFYGPVCHVVPLAGSVCTKQFSYQEQKLQRLCVDNKCQCMTGKSSPLIG